MGPLLQSPVLNPANPRHALLLPALSPTGSGPIDDEYKESVVDEIYKFDSRIDVGEMWKIRQVQVVGRERRREKMIKKKEEAVKHRTFQIVKNKTKIRQTKARIAKEEAKLRMTKEQVRVCKGWRGARSERLGGREERSDEALRIPRAEERSDVQRRHGHLPLRGSLRSSLTLARRRRVWPATSPRPL